VSGPPPRCPPEPVADDASSGSPALLLERCTFPEPGTPLTCGVSGGADSLALLVLASAAGCSVRAVHVDHGLRPGSDAEAAVVEAAADRFGASFETVPVEVGEGPNLEARARAARRAVLGQDAATGHTADDQAETVLLNLLRGAGVDGLAAMRAGPTHPLLGLRRAETVALCERLGLEPVADPSNRDPRFARNRVRHDLLPLCSAIAGRDVVPVLARQASLLAGDADLLAVLASLIDPEHAAAVGSAPEPAGRRAVRAWLTGDAPHPPPADAVERVLEVARTARLATEVPGGRRVARRSGRLSLGVPGPAAPARSTGAPVRSPRDQPGG
jgi:tRNA(Ile)-lysidine synthase